MTKKWLHILNDIWWIICCIAVPVLGTWERSYSFSTFFASLFIYIALDSAGFFTYITIIKNNLK